MATMRAPEARKTGTRKPQHSRFDVTPPSKSAYAARDWSPTTPRVHATQGPPNMMCNGPRHREQHPEVFFSSAHQLKPPLPLTSNSKWPCGGMLLRRTTSVARLWRGARSRRVQAPSKRGIEKPSRARCGFPYNSSRWRDGSWVVATPDSTASSAHALRSECRRGHEEAPKGPQQETTMAAATTTTTTTMAISSFLARRPPQKPASYVYHFGLNIQHIPPLPECRATPGEWLPPPPSRLRCGLARPPRCSLDDGVDDDHSNVTSSSDAVVCAPPGPCLPQDPTWL